MERRLLLVSVGAGKRGRGMWAKLLVLASISFFLPCSGLKRAPVSLGTPLVVDE